MGRLTLTLIRRFRQWERPAQVAMLVALALLLVVVVVAGFGPPDLRVPGLIGIMGLLLVMQLISLWANRDLVTPFTQAQRRFLQEDFDGALAILEAEHANLDAPGLTLLGNTYRQTGRLDESETALREALARSPNHHFPLYGLGRTLLAQGGYAEAATLLQASLDAGAPTPVKADLGEALHRAGQLEQARAVLERIDIATLEPYRALMVSFLRTGSAPPDLIAAGLPYWEAAAQRFAHTPYGAAVARDVEILQAKIA